MTTTSKINLAAVLLGLYAVYVLVGSLHYFFVLPGESDILRGLIRVVGVSLVSYGLLKGNRTAYWIALVGAGVTALFGTIGIATMVIFGQFWREILLLLIPVALLFATFVLLLPKEVRAQFKQASAADAVRGH